MIPRVSVTLPGCIRMTGLPVASVISAPFAVAVRWVPAGRSSFALVVVAKVCTAGAGAGVVVLPGTSALVWAMYIVEPAGESTTGTVTVASAVHGWLSVSKVQVPATFLPTAAKSTQP